MSSEYSRGDGIKSVTADDWFRAFEYMGQTPQNIQCKAG